MFDCGSRRSGALAIGAGRCNALNHSRHGYAGASATDRVLAMRNIQEATISEQSPQTTEALAIEMSMATEINVSAEPVAEMVVRSADVIVITPSTTEPIPSSEMLRPGQQISAMRSDQPNKRKLTRWSLARADICVAECVSLLCVQAGLCAANASDDTKDLRYPELVQIASGATSGRSSAEEIIQADLTRIGVQDAAIATLAIRRVADAGTSFSR